MSNLVKLQSSDGELFEVPVKVARMSTTISNLLNSLANNTESDDAEPIPLTKVDSTTLKLVIDWSTKHVDDPKADPEKDEDAERIEIIPHWDETFLKPLDDSTIFQLIEAANYLEIGGLLSVTCKTIAKDINGKTPEEIRARFGIEDDISEEEKKEILAKMEWCREN